MTEDVGIGITMVYYNHRLPTPNWEIIDHVLESTDVTYILDGEAIYYINEQAFLVRPGDLLCLPPGTRKRAHTFSDRLVESECINVKLFTRDGSPYLLPFPMISHIGYHPELHHLYAEIQKAWLMRPPTYHYHASAYFLLLLEHFSKMFLSQKTKQVADHRIRHAMEYIAAHFQEQLSLSDIAEMNCLSPMYFGNLFKQQAGISFRQYVTSIRLNQAESMLLSGEYRVGEVADLCGFSDVFYFSKVYRKQKGIAPSKVFFTGQKM